MATRMGLEGLVIPLAQVSWINRHAVASVRCRMSTFDELGIRGENVLSYSLKWSPQLEKLCYPTR